jgi:hypothetical protein
MNASIYVCHRSSDVELAARLVDLLELAFELPEGSLGCSALPGYADPAPRAEALRALGGHAEVVLVPLTEPLAPEQLLELGALWQAGRWIVALEGDPSALLRLPVPLDGVPHVSLPDRGALIELLEDIGYALGVVVRVGRVSNDAVAELCALWPGAGGAQTKVGDVSWALAASRATPVGEDTPDSEPERLLGASPETEPEPERMIETKPAPAPARKPRAPRSDPPPAQPNTVPPPGPRRKAAPAPAPQRVPSMPPPVVRDAGSTPPRVLNAVPAMPVRVPSMPPRAQSVPPPPPPRRASPPVSAHVDDDFEIVDASALDPVVEVSCELSLKAGRAISSCAFHGLEGHAIDADLDESFGRFLDAVGGQWEELRNIADPDVWLGVTDNLLESLPAGQRHLSSWYELGFQLTTLHNLATEEMPDDVEGLRVYQQAFDDALDAFRQSAASARLSYQDVAELEGLLRNLSGPMQQRDYSNISLSLAQLAFHAEQADLGFN